MQYSENTLFQFHVLLILFFNLFVKVWLWTRGKLQENWWDNTYCGFVRRLYLHVYIVHFIILQSCVICFLHLFMPERFLGLTSRFPFDHWSTFQTTLITHGIIKGKLSNHIYKSKMSIVIQYNYFSDNLFVPKNICDSMYLPISDCASDLSCLNKHTCHESVRIYHNKYQLFKNKSG